MNPTNHNRGLFIPLTVQHGAGLMVLLITLLFFPVPITAQPPDPEYHVYPVGNLADLEGDSEEIEALAAAVEKNKCPAVIVFSGDISKSDLTERSQRAQDSIRLSAIIRQLQSDLIIKLVFIPGDRDWSYSGRKGWENVTILEGIVEALPFENIKWTPGHGCPGPKEIDLADHLTLVVINTQYWNHPYDKPSPADAVCKISSPHDFMEELEDIIAEAGNKNVLIAGHFPVMSGGEYGGHMTIKKHLFPLTDVHPGLWIPLPAAGSFYPAYRKNVGSSMDIINENYEDFNASIGNIFRDHPGLICISGHDYTTQLIYSGQSYFVNNGGMKHNKVAGKIKENRYIGREKGLIRLEYLSNGDVMATGFHLQNNALVKEESMELYRSACLGPKDGIPVNEHYAPCNERTIFSEKMAAPFDQVVSVTGGAEYQASGFKSIFLGWHYRDSWTAAIQTRYLNLDTTFGGLTPIKRGGGRQTTSLKFRAGNGCEYVFRSVNKDPKKALSYELRETIVADIIKDQTSTQQPYGALATRDLLDTLEILHPSPHLYVLPPDDKLGPFREEFSGLLGMLEESPKSPAGSCPGFGGSDEVIRSYKLFRKLYKSHDSQVDQVEFAKARVFDILAGDWGRHEDNWKWAGYSTGEKTVYRPIPRDRDHVFSVWDGLLPWIADREWAKPSGEHFGFKVRDVRSLTWSARHLDRVLLTGVTKSDWLDQTAIVKDKMTDALIESSVANMPAPIYDVDGKEISNKLKARRDRLEDYILDYYSLIAKQVDVLGSAQREVFTVDRHPDGTVEVRVTNHKGTEEHYKRRFYGDETKEIRLFGLGDEDVFRIRGESQKSILVRVIGGEGNDSISDLSNVKGARKMTRIYEKGSASTIIPGKEAKIVHSHNEKMYDYDRHAFAYNTYFPLPFLGFNADDGLILGIGVTFKRQRFGKEDYHARHSFDLKGSTSGNLQFGYEGQLHHAIGKWDVLYYGLLAYPTDFVSFYGYGNETKKSDSLYKADYYKTRYNSIRIGAGVLHDFLKRSRFTVLLNYENNEGQISDNTILDIPLDFPGKDKVNLYEAVAALDLDFRNDKKFPERGARFFGEFVQGLITSNQNSTYNKTTGFVEFHATIPSKLPVFVGIKGGGAFSNGDIPFYKLVNIGQNNYLRGYRKNRFAGRSMAFLNADLKLQILDIATPVVPVKFGLRGFCDLGKVFVKDEKSSTLHLGYGGGIYLIPLEKSYSLALNMAFSEEEKNGLFVFEFGISF